MGGGSQVPDQYAAGCQPKCVDTLDSAGHGFQDHRPVGSGTGTAGVPCGPINDLAQVFADPQVQARGLAIELPHALGGVVPQVASPIRLSETPVEYRRAPPLLGEHSEQVLNDWLALGADEIALLRQAGVI